MKKNKNFYFKIENIKPGFVFVTSSRVYYEIFLILRNIKRSDGYFLLSYFRFSDESSMIIEDILFAPGDVFSENLNHYKEVILLNGSSIS